MDGRHVHHPEGQLLGGLRERRSVCSLCVQNQLKWICPSSLKGHIRARQQVYAQTKVTGHGQHWEPLFLETDPRRYNLLITYSGFLGRRPGYTQPSASSMRPAGVLSPSALILSGERGVQGPPTQRTGGSSLPGLDLELWWVPLTTYPLGLCQDLDGGQGECCPPGTAKPSGPDSSKGHSSAYWIQAVTQCTKQP